MIDRIRVWARGIKTDVVAIYIAGRDPRTPWHAKAVAIFVAAYALSPIDLIPDFIPVLGYLDDLIIVPLGIMIVRRLIPAGLMSEFRKAAALQSRKPVSQIAAVAIVALWVIGAIILGTFVWPKLVEIF